MEYKEELEENIEETNEESLRDTLESAFEETEEMKEDITSESVTEETEEQKAERARDELGRFAKESPTNGEIEQGKDAITPIQTPRSFSADERKAFESLPLELKTLATDYFARQERAIAQASNQKLQEIDRVRRSLADVEQALEPRMKSFASQGVTPGQVISNLLNAQDYLDENPVEGIKWLMGQYGLTAESFFNSQGTSQSTPIPQLESVYQELGSLKNYIANIENEKQERILNSAQEEIRAFAEERDNLGNLVRPDFQSYINNPTFHSTVEMIMNEKPNASQKEILKDAYEWFKFRDPNNRNFSQSPSREEVVQKAKRAKGIVGSSSVTNFENTPPKNLRDAIEQAYDAHS